MDDFPSEGERRVPDPPASPAMADRDNLGDTPLRAFDEEPALEVDSAFVSDAARASAAGPLDLDFPTEFAAPAGDPNPFDAPVQDFQEPPTVAAAPGNRRELMLVMLAVLFGGIVTFALLSSRGRAETAASAPAPAASAARGPRAASPTATAPRWKTATREWVGKERHAAAFELPAVNKVQAWTHQAHPILVVRCVAKRVESFVYIESAAQLEARDENHAVRVRFDDGNESAERWADSDEHDALFAPDGAGFARRLMSARSLHFSYTPHNSPRAQVEFQVGGLRELVEPAAKACGLTP